MNPHISERTAPGHQLVSGTFELHVFVDPLNPDQDTVERFAQACLDSSTTGRRIKSLLLYLDFSHLGFASVMQTSRYIEGTLADAWIEVARDAQMLRDAGFVVLREKIEALLGNAHVPRTNAAAGQLLGGQYFEYHLLLRNTEPDRPISLADQDRLRAIAAALSVDLQMRIPLSYNALKDDRWFVNARTYGLGLEESTARIKQIEDAIEALDSLEVVKVIREFIVGDTLKALDNGWLEPLPAG